MPFTPPNIGTSVLRVLHRIHRQLTDLRERLDRGPRQIRAAETNVAHCEAQLAHVKDEAKSIRMASDKQQLQLKSGEDKIKDLRRKLNAATSNREYQALLEQIAADEMTNSVLADEILEALEKSDVAQNGIAESEAVLAAARQKAAEVRAEVAKLEPSLQADIARLEAELRESEATLPPDIRELYNRIVRRKGEDALAVVENQYCGGCNQQVPINLCSQVMLGQPVACKTCGRLLYLPE
jgi:predicted  nucleic acid-binding Zn-ribbon protein